MNRVHSIPFAALLVGLLLIALVHPISLDESQYVPATAFASEGLLPYRDFAYLQTPLQPFIFAPLNWFFPGHLFLACRIANALLAFATTLVVHATSRRLGAAREPALVASFLLPTCYAFLWGAGVGRNDMLPAMLLAAGLWAWVSAGRSWKLFAAGIALGLAAGVKISYALPAAAAVCASLMSRHEPDRRKLLWVIAGGLLALTPALALALAAPRAFLFEAFEFPARAPVLWYHEMGGDWRLGPFRLFHLLAVAAMGPALLAFVEVARRIHRHPRDWLHDSNRRLLLAAAAGGLLSALLNRPFQTQYLIPALPPLFMMLALCLSDGQPIGLGRRVAWTISVSAGLLIPIAWIGRAAVNRDAPAVVVDKTSRQLGAALRATGARGPVASFYGAYVIDSGCRLDRRFAAGPVLFRTHGMISAADANHWHIVTRDAMKGLSAIPPGAFVGPAGPRDDDPVKVRKFAASDALLLATADRLGYKAAAWVGALTIWLRPMVAVPARPRAGSANVGAC